MIFVRPSGVSCQSQPARYLQAAPPVGKLQSADRWIRLHLVRLGWAKFGWARWALFSTGLIGPRPYQHSGVPYQYLPELYQHFTKILVQSDPGDPGQSAQSAGLPSVLRADRIGSRGGEWHCVHWWAIGVAVSCRELNQ